MEIPDPLVRQELLRHELTCWQEGHYDAIFYQQVDFPENYQYGAYEEDEYGYKYIPGMNGNFKKPFKGKLGTAIRSLITMHQEVGSLVK